jgi:hypothetical protein
MRERFGGESVSASTNAARAPMVGRLVQPNPARAIFPPRGMPSSGGGRIRRVDDPKVIGRSAKERPALRTDRDATR